MRLIRYFWGQVCNFFYYGWNLRNTVDWNHTSIYEVLQLKLKQLQRGCYHNGHHVWSKKSREYKALLECIHLCSLLQESYNYNLMQIDMTKLYIDGYKFVNDMSKQESKWLRYATAKDSEVEKNRKERLHFLLNKWSDFWWD